MSLAVLLSVDDFLAHAGLYVLIHIGIGETQQQAVRPALVNDAQFADNCFVVVGVVEAFHPFFLASVDTTCFEVFYRGVYIVVIVRIVLERVDLVGEAVLEGLAEVDVRFMRVERTVGIGGV